MIEVPDVGKTALNWQLWVGSVSGATDWFWRVHLFVSNVPLNSATTLADLVAAEATFDDYTFLPLVFAFDGGIILPDDVSRFVFLPVLWTVGALGGTDTVYGYWVDGITNGGGRELLFVELAPVPVPMNLPGLSFGFTPLFNLRRI